MISYNDDISNVYSKTFDKLSTVYCLTGQDDILTSKKLPGVRVPLPAQHPLYKAHTATPSNTFFVTLSTKDEFSYYANGVKFTGSIDTQGTTLSSDVDILHGNGVTYFNKAENLLYYVLGSKFSMYYYDYSAECGELGFIDRIDISLSNRVLDLTNVTFGKNYRCAITENNGEPILEVSGVRDSYQLFSANVEDLDITTVISTSQRFEDDAYVILYIQNGVVKLRVYDLQRLINSSTATMPRSKVVNASKRSIIYDAPVEGGIGLNHIIEFAPFDSDIIICRLYRHKKLAEVQFRSISNPRYPIATFNGYARTGNLGVYSPSLDSLATQLDRITSPLNNLGEGDPFPIFDMQFDVADTIRCLVLYQHSVEIFHVSDVYKSCLPINLPKKYQTNTISSGSSIGLVFNNALRYLIYDTLTLYKACRSRFTYDPYTGSYIGLSPVYLPSLSDLNLYIYENESFNVGVLDRIFVTLQQIQQNIARAIIQPV
jgi:hypothetical protein